MTKEHTTSLKYGSTINGTATETSDIDIKHTYIYLEELDSSGSVFKYVVKKETTRPPIGETHYATFLRDCFLGHPFTLDQLYLADEHYLVPLLDCLIRARDERLFITQTAITLYSTFFLNWIKSDPSKYNNKKGYHTVMSMLMAKDMAEGRPPDFSCAANRQMLIDAKTSWDADTFARETTSLLKAITDKDITELPMFPDFRRVNELYKETLDCLKSQKDTSCT